MLTLINCPSYINSRFFSPLSAGTGICDGFLCMLPFQRSVLISKVMSLWCYSVSVLRRLFGFCYQFYFFKQSALNYART